MLDSTLRPQGNPRVTRRTRRSHITDVTAAHHSQANNGPWGDRLQQNKDGFRIAFQNINGLPTAPTPDQDQTLVKTLQTYEIDVLGVQEINLNLTAMEPTHSWERRFKGSNLFNVVAHNQHTTSQDRRLFGGTAMFAAPSATARITEHGKDETGLGRWTWISITGKRGLNTKILTGYRPVRDFSNRPGTVYSQHEKFFYAQGQPREPRLAFLHDLGTLLRQWIERGSQIVLGLDLNEYIFSSDINHWVGQLGLIPILSHLHPQLPEVDTCDKSYRNRPIDGIWTSPGLDVVQGGMTGFGDFLIRASDHRMLWLDISYDSMLGHSPSPIPPKPKQIFSIHDPLFIRKYNNYVRKQRNIHRIPEKLATLQTKINEGCFTNHDEAIYNQLCLLDDGIRTQAKRKARPYYAGQVLYSDVIGQDYHEIRLWQLIQKRLSGRRVDTRHIRRLMRSTNQPTALRMLPEEVLTAQQACIRRYRKHKKDQVRLREQFERKQDKRLAEAKGITLTSQQKTTKMTRQTRHVFANIRAVMGNRQRLPLHKVEYVNDNNQTIECNDKTEIEQACSLEGQRRFTQNADTPFLQGSLLQDLGYHGHQHTVDLLLTGQYECLEDVEEYTRMFINEITMPPEIENLTPITGLTTSQEHSNAWTKMRATTASSPFGPLFTDYIAGSHDAEVTKVDNLLAAIPLQAAFCPQLWTKAVDVMIPKKQTSINVEKLRIIVLFHAMYNMVNKRVGRSMVQRAHDQQLIPLEAFGSVPNRQANVCALNKALVNDILRQQRRPAALCSNDATSCYDRIVHVVASICMQRLGVAAPTCKVMFGTLSKLQHYVSTAYGVSNTPYGAIQFPLQGIGQGNGAGPAIWLVITIPLINMLRRRGYGFQSISPITHHRCHLACFTYVDDTDTIHAPVGHSTYQQVTSGLQEAINIWAGGLRATGGTLSPEKSYWYLIDFEWQPKTLTWRYKTMQESPGDIYFMNSNGHQCRIQRHETQTAVETLGIPLAMDGNQNAIYAGLLTRIEKWASKIQSRQLTTREAFISLQSGISKSLEYPLVATRLSKHQCNSLMQPLRKAALPALGIPVTFPTLLVHAPKDYLGLGFPNMWYEQGYLHVGCLLQHYNDLLRDSTAQLYLHTMEGMRLELGLSNFPLTYDYYKFHLCTTTTQLHIAWQFCTDTGLSIQDSTPCHQAPRQRDMHLMEFFATCTYSAKELRLLNLCRMYLRIIFVSDLATGKGTHLDSQFLQQRQPFNHHTEYNWPPAGNPSKHCWAMWDAAIQQLVHPADRHSTYRLKQDLGAWTRTPPGWTSFLDPVSGRMYRRDAQNLYSFATPLPQRYGTRNTRYLQQDGRILLPTSAVPTTAQIRGRLWSHTGITSHHNLQHPDDNQWASTVLRRPSHMQHLIHGIRTGTAIMVTDGSFKDGLGTAAFALRGHLMDLDGVDAVNMTPGWHGEIDPYRAELGGIYGCISFANLLARQYSLSSGSITLACDCSSALIRLQQLRSPKPSTAQYDLLMACRLELAASPLTWKFRHVRGHQDSHQDYRLLDRYSQLNVDMDKLAKLYWHLLNANRPLPFSLPTVAGTISIWAGPHRLTTWTRAVAQKHFFNRPISTYWQDRSPTSLQAIDWDACGRALRRVTATQQLWIPRWLTSFLPTGNRVRFMNTAHTHLCPRCQEAEDHRFHVIRCPHPEAQIIWQQRVQQLDSWLITQHTKPSLRRTIVAILQHWYTQTIWNPPISSDAMDTEVFQAQSRAGTHRFLDGFLVHHWAEVQHHHYLWMKRRTTGARWLSSLIQKLWEIAWDLWRHRHKIMLATDSLAISRLHTDVDEAITQAYAQYTPDPPLHLARWFARPLPSLTSETLDFKRQWLEMIATLVGD